MKISYYLHHVEARNGVYKKVISQAKAWEALGVDVNLFVLTRNDDVADAFNQDLPGRVVIGRYSKANFLTLVLSRMRSTARIVARIRKDNPDIVYFRPDVINSALLGLARTQRTILEINSDDVIEYKMGPKARLLVHFFFRRRFLHTLAGAVFVTHELATHPSYGSVAGLRKVIGNGIDLSGHNPLPVSERSGIHAAFLGTNSQPWHGLPDILKLATRLPHWKFSLIGPKLSSVDTAVPANVTFFGTLDTAEYRPILADATIAIGTLGLWKKRMKEACPLKTREYLALGLPVIIGYEETDFPEPRTFLFRVPNREGGILEDISGLEAFAESWRHRRVKTEDVINLDARRKEAQRLQFFQKVLTGPAFGKSVPIPSEVTSTQARGSH